MNLARVALKTVALKAWAFERATKKPLKHQERVLFEYLRRNKDTEYGKIYGFASIRSIAEYQARVPMSDSESIRPYVDEMIKGASNVLVKDRVISYATTSGTTGHRKLIPVTAYSAAKKAEIMKLWAYYITRDHPNILKGKIFAIISPEIEGYTDSGVPYGAESGHGYKNLPSVIRHLYALPYEVFEIKDYESRYYAALRIAVEQDITTVAALNPSAIVLLCQNMEKWKERIIKDIEEGALDKDLKIHEDLRRKIEKMLKPNPDRAQDLKNIVKKNAGFLPKYIWPNVELIECWKGGTVKLYLKELPKYFGDVHVRDFGCLSTEARSSIPMSDAGAGGVLAINANFYEFIPKEDIGKRKKRFLLCSQVEKGKEYFIVVTTPGGLYRYNIDDIVTVDGFFNSTPMIEFVQKGMGAFSITGEKIYESHINEAVNFAADKIKLFPEFFSASVQWDKPPRYIFLVEFNDEPSADKKRAFLKLIEEGLYDQNTEYMELRQQELLGSPILKVVQRGEFERYRARRVAEGAHDGQFKVPELIPDSDFQKNFDITEEIPFQPNK